MLAALLSLTSQMGGLPAQLPIQPRSLDVRINFQSESAAVPAGHLRDFGEPFGPRTGTDQSHGLRYGWVAPVDGTPLDLVGLGRDREAVADQRLDTLVHMDHPSPTQPGPGVWELAVAPGDYTVEVICGDPAHVDSVHRVVIEGLVAISGFEPTAVDRHVSARVVVTVDDGRLTIDSSGGENTKLNAVAVSRGARARPRPTIVTPEDGASDVAVDAFVSTDLYLPYGGLDPATVTPRSVFLYPSDEPGLRVPAVVNTTGGGDAIVLDPVGNLDPGTDYVFEVTPDVRDLSGTRCVAFRSTFRTTADEPDGLDGVRFDRATVASAAQYTSLEVGPDGKLYALVNDGAIHRFTIEPDGTLSNQEPLFSLMTAEGGARLAIGLTHDPASTANAPIVWVSHTTFGFQNMPDWGGKLSRLSGPDLETVETVVAGLPRSTRDHVSNGIAFGPDGALYLVQGSNSAMGAPDTAWGNRPERLLSAAVCVLIPRCSRACRSTSRRARAAATIPSRLGRRSRCTPAACATRTTSRGIRTVRSTYRPTAPRRGAARQPRPIRCPARAACVSTASTPDLRSPVSTA